MKKTYADMCLELAGKATEGPWKWQDSYEHVEHRKAGLNAKCENIDAGRITLEPAVLSEWSGDGDSGLNIHKNDAEFIAASRDMVPELARRLERACGVLRAVGNFVKINGLYDHYNKIADELEAIPGEEK